MAMQDWDFQASESTVDDEAEGMTVLEAEAKRPYKLEEGCVAMLVVHLPLDEHIIVLNLHHIRL